MRDGGNSRSVKIAEASTETTRDISISEASRVTSLLPSISTSTSTFVLPLVISLGYIFHFFFFFLFNIAFRPRTVPKHTREPSPPTCHALFERLLFFYHSLGHALALSLIFPSSASRKYLFRRGIKFLFICQFPFKFIAR